MSKRQKPYCGIMLAAGSSKRFGGNKLTTRLANQLTVLETSCRNAKQAIQSLSVITREGAQKAQQILRDLNIHFVINPCAQRDGMSSSIKLGIQKPESNDISGWLIFLADMPCIKPETIRSVVSIAEQTNQIVIPVYNGKQGHPVAFPLRYKQDLEKIFGDQGAKDIIETYRNEVVNFETDDPGILLDLDTQDDLRQINKNLATDKKLSIQY